MIDYWELPHLCFHHNLVLGSHELFQRWPGPCWGLQYPYPHLLLQKMLSLPLYIKAKQVTISVFWLFVTNARLNLTVWKKLNWLRVRYLFSDFYNKCSFKFSRLKKVKLVKGTTGRHQNVYHSQSSLKKYLFWSDRNLTQVKKTFGDLCNNMSGALKDQSLGQGQGIQMYFFLPQQGVCFHG